MIKRLIGFILAIMIAASCIHVCVFAETDSNAHAINVVTGIGFVPKVEDYNEVVTRAEFATVALKLYNEDTADEFTTGVDTVYPDVTADHYKSSDIAMAYDTGIMRGYGDGNFYPEEPLQTAQAIKIIMDLLGYKEYVSYNGGYPSGYMSQAVYTGVTSGVSKNYSDPITYGELCRVIYNAFDNSMVVMEYITASSASYIKDSTITFLEKYHNIYKSEGVITANFVTKINGVSSLNKNQLEINGSIFMSSSDEFDSLIGYNTEYYYEKTAEGNILHCAVAVNNTELEIYGRDITYAGNGSIKVKQNSGNTRDVNLAQNGNVIYNGAYLSKVINYDLSKLVDLTAKVRLIDTDRDNLYDVIFITEYKNYILDKALVSENKIFLKGSSYYIELDENTSSQILLNGEQIDISNLEGGSLVSVALSENFFTTNGKRHAEIVVSPTLIDAKVDSLSDDEVMLSITEGKNTMVTGYKISKNFIGENNAVINLRSSGTFHLDALGEIGYYQQGRDNVMKYGYIMAAGRTSRIGGKFELKILSEDGEIICFAVADKVNVDGEKKEAMQLESILSSSSTMPGEIKQLIRYKLNSDGEVSVIDTTLPNSDNDTNALAMTTVNSNGVSWAMDIKTLKVSGSIERYIVNSDVKLFVVPTYNGATDEDYFVSTNKYFGDEGTFGRESSGEQLIMYNVDKAEPKIMELRTEKVDTGLGGISQYNADMAVIESVSKGVDSEGDDCMFLDVMVSKEKKTLVVPIGDVKFLRLVEDEISAGTSFEFDNVTPMSIDNLKFGDCILYYEDANGKVRTILRMNDYNIFEACEDGPVYYGSQNAGSYLERTWASVRDIDKKKMLLDTSNIEGDLWLNAVSVGMQFYLVNSEDETVTVASMDDIIYSPYDEYADKVFIRIRANEIKQVVIYR